MSGETQLLLIIAGVHVLGLACVAVLMLPALRDAPEPRWPSDSDSDDGWGRGPRHPPSPPDSPRGGIPLPDAVQSRIRLREPGPFFGRLPAHERRPAREPQRPPVRTP